MVCPLIWFRVLLAKITWSRIGGFSYEDVLHIYGVSRAGYIPQLFSLRLPNPTVIYELLRSAGAETLIHDGTFASNLDNCPVPAYSTIDTDLSISANDLPPTAPSPSASDIAFIFHTSGSTSGSPKLVPCSYKWLDSAVQKSHQISKPIDPARQDVTVWMLVALFRRRLPSLIN